MARKISFNETLREAARLKVVWKKIPKFEMGEFALRDFVDMVEETRTLIDEYATKKGDLARLKQTRDDKTRALSNVITRFRSGVRSHFGPDSVEYAQAGGTRSSARKPRKRGA